MIDETVKLPAVLRGKLEFGNQAQIDALADIERDITRQEERLGYPVGLVIKVILRKQARKGAAEGGAVIHSRRVAQLQVGAVEAVGLAAVSWERT